MPQIQSQSTHVGITAVGEAFPEKRLTNADFETMIDTNDQWIVERTGIRERRVVAGETASDLGARAAREALQKRGLTPDDIDCVIVCTVTPELMFPSTACLILGKLNAKNKWGYDLSAACSGFVFGLNAAYQMVRGNPRQRVLVIGVDIMTSITDYQDRATSILFGDGAGAVLIEKVNPPYGIIDVISYCEEPPAPDLLYMPAGGSRRPASLETVQNKEHFLRQNGREVYKYAVQRMQEISDEILAKNNIRKEELNFFIPHQANLRIMEVAAKRLGLPKEKMGVNIDKYGNTTSATIPTCLCESLAEGKIKKGDLVLFATFGAGFTRGSALMRWAYEPAFPGK